MTGLRNTRKRNRDQSVYGITQSCQTSFEQSKRTSVVCAIDDCHESNILDQRRRFTSLTAKLTGPLVLAVSAEQKKIFLYESEFFFHLKEESTNAIVHDQS